MNVLVNVNVPEKIGFLFRARLRRVLLRLFRKAGFEDDDAHRLT